MIGRLHISRHVKCGPISQITCDKALSTAMYVPLFLDTTNPILTMIRISWCHKEGPEEHYHGSWYPNEDEAVLVSWIEILSKLHPTISHWIETDSGDS